MATSGRKQTYAIMAGALAALLEATLKCASRR
jgi:hypothetical protein